MSHSFLSEVRRLGHGSTEQDTLDLMNQNEGDNREEDSSQLGSASLETSSEEILQLASPSPDNDADCKSESNVLVTTIEVQTEEQEEPINSQPIDEAQVVTIEVLDSSCKIADLDSLDNANTEELLSQSQVVQVVSTEMPFSDLIPEMPFSDLIPDGKPSQEDELNRQASSAKQLADLSTELDAAKQRENDLKKHVSDLEEQLSQQRNTVEKLRLDVEVIQVSKQELLAELTEAKRYILQLTASPQPPVEQKTPQQTSKPPVTATSHMSPERVRRETLVRSPQTHLRQPSKRAIPAASIEPSALSLSRPKGLPPMSTERLSSSPVDEHKPDNTSSSAPGKLQPLSSAAPHKLQSLSRRPFVPRDRPIPDSARDTHTKIPKPKLSDSEISWFD
ncbi:MAG: hypothetical protein AAF327_03545 [Cyanobacteria bacterium P01_A01_bin.37]